MSSGSKLKTDFSSEIKSDEEVLPFDYPQEDSIISRETIYPPGKIVFNGAVGSLDGIPNLVIERLAATIMDVAVPYISSQIINSYDRVKYAWASRIIIAQATAIIQVTKKEIAKKRQNSYQTTKSILSKYKTYNLAELRDLQTNLGIRLDHLSTTLTRESALYGVAIEVATRIVRWQPNIPRGTPFDSL